MTIRLKILLIMIALFALIFIFNLIRKKVVDLKHVLMWIFTASMILIFSLFPSLIGIISKLLGIKEEVNSLFFLNGVLLIMTVFSLSIVQSKNSRKLKKCIQELTLLKKELEEKESVEVKK
ncbi:DUF2304 domain-containing protein [Sebaldella sp. S0638]|uniref:DUF2304 domain-containing protein n=1 Tax=Sebaldella sp. S0638 TaxID=2957809 RepID=UPI00209F807E|nr:DUF2304 domain-containing protein [Sebaldella sp. S0638]MCP1225887.1 DUF2304 domain-containing protein [Sebaldella sp. S0638]